MKALTERRKADREAMAAEIRALATELGATVEDGYAFDPQEIALEIHHAGGAYLPLDFDGKSCQPDVHVACWNVRSDSAACFSASFGDVNTYHFRKCQFVARGFASLLAQVRRDLEALNDGSGYSAERTAKHAAEFPARFEPASV